jgi:DNA-binding transcriptional regulator YhcF (GntR family)
MRSKPPAARGSSQAAEAIVEEAYIHLSAGDHTTRTLAEALGVSTATAFRAIKALRRRGVAIESAKKGRHWYFELDDDEAVARAWKRDPLLSLIGFVRGRKRRGQSVDDVVYGRK